MKKAIQKDPQAKTILRTVIGIPVRDLSLYKAALTHPSFRNEYFKKERLEDFDRLEFLGDSILNEIICQKLFSKFPDADEGMLSKLRSILVSQRILSRIAKSLKLQTVLRLGNSLRHQFKGPLQTKLLTDAFEALLAAIYFDHGHDKVERFILKNFKGYFDPKLLFRLDPNPKSTLQEMTLKRWQKLPEYTYTYSEKGVKTTVAVDRRRRASGLHKIKRESELKAARALIQRLRKELRKK
ncbi:MAG TPA: ribonuclease III [Candidatus Omnitrophota bacterium]|nr:ribonuclease III [Candidatus Omnitrophota bacterium]HPS36438.1 ribonuclease III [Candidatus Omnitrophota bacterium]